MVDELRWTAREAIEFRILGPVEVRRGGEPLPLGGRRPLAVLTQLVINVGRVISVDRLADGLWGENLPPAARPTLQSYVSRLRTVLDGDRAVGGQASLVAGRPGGYLLDVEPGAVDARRFEQVSARARAALAAGRPENAAALFEEALGLWRGPALADFADEPFAVAEATRLEELRLSAYEDHVETAFALGRHRTVVAELEQLVAAHPFRERFRAQLMVALYRSGRQPEALRVYQAGRRLLREELGIEPAPALKGLEAAILRHDPALDWWPGADPAVQPLGRPAPAADPLLLALIDQGIVSEECLPDWVLVVVSPGRDTGAAQIGPIAVVLRPTGPAPTDRENIGPPVLPAGGTPRRAVVMRPAEAAAGAARSVRDRHIPTYA